MAHRRTYLRHAPHVALLCGALLIHQVEASRGFVCAVSTMGTTGARADVR